MVLMNHLGVSFGIANGWIMLIVATIAGVSRNLREKTRLENAVHPISGSAIHRRFAYAGPIGLWRIGAYENQTVV